MSDPDRDPVDLPAVARRVGAAAARAGTREAVEGSIPGAATEGGVRFAWVGRREGDGLRVTARDGEGAFVDGIDPGSDLPGPWRRALAERSVVVLDPGDAGDPWSETASEAGAVTVAVVPLAGEETVHGTLTLYDDREGAFGDRETLAELGGTAGHAIDGALARADLEGALREERRFGGVARRIPDPVSVKDRKGRYLAVNDRFLALTGTAEASVLGKTDEDVFDPADAARFRAADRTVLDAESPLRREEETTVDGRELVFEAVRVPHYEDGELAGTATVRRDVTERVDREAALEGRNERLDTFASVVSHDLRNPLDIAAGYVGKARETGAEEDFDEIASAIERSKAIVDELLTLARADRRLGDLVDLEVAAVAESAWNTVDTGDATVEVTTDRTVAADEGQLQRLLENLFRNAVEHGGPGVTVRVGDADGGFFVADDGPGIPPEKRDRALEPGYTTRDDGTGLGLAIVGRIAEAHGWEVALSESAGGGVRVDVTV